MCAGRMPSNSNWLESPGWGWAMSLTWQAAQSSLLGAVLWNMSSESVCLRVELLGAKRRSTTEVGGIAQIFGRARGEWDRPDNPGEWGLGVTGRTKESVGDGHGLVNLAVLNEIGESFGAVTLGAGGWNGAVGIPIP